MGAETSLDDILSDEGDIEEAAETIGQPRDDAGKFTNAEPGVEEEVADPIQEGPPSTEQEPSHIPVAALKAEREKRQQVEAERQQIADRLKQYETYFDQLQQPEDLGPPDPQVDPNGYAQWVRQQVMQEVQQNVASTGEQYIARARIEVAETLARQKWADYDEKIETFKEAAKANPFLVAELQKAPNPAEYAYNAVARMQEAKQYGTAPSRAEMEAQIRSEILAELNIPQAKAPFSMATERSVGGRSGPAWSGPASLDNILGS